MPQTAPDTMSTRVEGSGTAMTGDDPGIVPAHLGSWVSQKCFAENQHCKVSAVSESERCAPRV